MEQHHVLGSLDIALDAVAYEAVAFTDAAAVGLTATKIQPSSSVRKRRKATISLETGGVDARYTIDGTTPTAAIGHLVSDGDLIDLNGHNLLSKFKIILVAAGTGSAKTTYYE